MEEKRHYSVIDTYNRKVTLKYKNEAIAITTNALILKEVVKSVCNPVFYLPKEDVQINLEVELTRQSHCHCPIKGDASYWNVEGNFTENYFAWS